jgi:hypothetical protein
MGPHRSGTTILCRILAATGCFNTSTAYHILNRDRLLELYFTGQEQAAKEALKRLFVSRGMYGVEYNSMRLGPDSIEEYGFALDYQGRRPLLDRRNLRGFDEFCRKLQLIQDPGRPLLLKNPYDTLNFIQIHQVFPAARFIFIYRHPVDVINSQTRLLRSFFRERDEYHFLLHNRYRRMYQRPIQLALARMIYSERLGLFVRQVSHYVSSNFDYILEHVDDLGETAIGLTYQELCRRPNTVVQRVLAFLGETERTPRDYSDMIQTRTSPILPEVERHRAWIGKRNAAYWRRFGDY